MPRNQITQLNVLGMDLISGHYISDIRPDIIFIIRSDIWYLTVFFVLNVVFGRISILISGPDILVGQIPKAVYLISDNIFGISKYPVSGRIFGNVYGIRPDIEFSIRSLPNIWPSTANIYPVAGYPVNIIPVHLCRIKC